MNERTCDQVFKEGRTVQVAQLGTVLVRMVGNGARDTARVAACIRECYECVSASKCVE